MPIELTTIYTIYVLSVIKGVSDGQIVVRGKQVAPCRVAVIIVGCTQQRSHCGSRICIFFSASDITRIVIGPVPCLACRLVILANQLIGRVVSIGGSMRSVADTEDIA